MTKLCPETSTRSFFFSFKFSKVMLGLFNFFRFPMISGFVCLFHKYCCCICLYSFLCSYCWLLLIQIQMKLDLIPCLKPKLSPRVSEMINKIVTTTNHIELADYLLTCKIQDEIEPVNYFTLLLFFIILLGLKQHILNLVHLFFRSL